MPKTLTEWKISGKDLDRDQIFDEGEKLFEWMHPRDITGILFYGMELGKILKFPRGYTICKENLLPM